MPACPQGLQTKLVPDSVNYSFEGPSGYQIIDAQSPCRVTRNQGAATTPRRSYERPSTTIRSERAIKTTARPVASAASQRLFHFPCNLSNSLHSNGCAKLVKPQRDPVRSPNVLPRLCATVIPRSCKC